MITINAEIIKQNDCIMYSGLVNKREWYACHYLEKSGIEITFILIRDSPDLG